MEDLKTKIREEVIEQQSATDFVTLFIILVSLTIHALVGYLHFTGKVSFLLSALICCFIMNMSFTFWHECSHENLSRNRHLNSLVGILTSFFSFFPGYYARRREHLIHHKFEGIPGKDPVYYRLQKTSFLRFLWTAVVVNYLEKRPDEVPETFLSLSTGQKIIDKLTVGSVLAIIGALIWAGKWDVALATIIVPRVFIFIYHGYVICFFPHFLPEGGFQKFRAYLGNPVIQLITMNQNFHGIHHYSPKVRWYNYKVVVQRYQKYFPENNIEIKR